MRAPEYPELRGHRLGTESQAEGKRGGGLWSRPASEPLHVAAVQGPERERSHLSGTGGR